MKQSEVKHILEDRETLVFTDIIGAFSGGKHGSYWKPSGFQHVKHLTGNLYYAYDDDCESVGKVFLGEFK